jgi:hypothetical protein
MYLDLRSTTTQERLIDPTQFGGFLLYQDPRTNYIITGGFIYTINYTVTILCRTATGSFCNVADLL